jgi:hypothetical protein
MRLRLMLVTAILAGALLAARLEARIQDEILCWEPDIEFPVPCDDEDG